MSQNLKWISIYVNHVVLFENSVIILNTFYFEYLKLFMRFNTKKCDNVLCFDFMDCRTN